MHQIGTSHNAKIIFIVVQIDSPSKQKLKRRDTAYFARVLAFQKANPLRAFLSSLAKIFLVQGRNSKGHI